MTLHPATVHFPIALLLVSVLLTLLYLRQGERSEGERSEGERSLDTSAYHCLLIGWFGAVLAVLTGSVDAWRQVYGVDTPRDPALLNRVNIHAALGIATVWVFGMALLRRRRNPYILDDPQQRRGYVRLLLFGALLVIGGGWLGGQLVYSFGLGVQL